MRQTQSPVALQSPFAVASLRRAILGLWLTATVVAAIICVVGFRIGFGSQPTIPRSRTTDSFSKISTAVSGFSWVCNDLRRIERPWTRTATSWSRSKACEQAVVGVGLQMVMTSVILVVAFSIMGLSDFIPTSQFGLLSSLTIILALVADLTLLPVILSWRHRESAEQLRINPALAANVVPAHALSQDRFDQAGHEILICWKALDSTGRIQRPAK